MRESLRTLSRSSADTIGESCFYLIQQIMIKATRQQKRATILRQGIGEGYSKHLTPTKVLPFCSFEAEKDSI